MTIDIFLYMILRPPANETTHYLNKYITTFATTHKHHFSVKQCEALEIALEITKVHDLLFSIHLLLVAWQEFFLSYKEVNLKPAMLDKSITKATQVISLFRLQTTELIKMFLAEASKQRTQGLTKCCMIDQYNAFCSSNYANGNSWDTQYRNTTEAYKSRQKQP